MENKRSFSDIFLENVTKIIYKVLRKENLLTSPFHLGKVESVISPTKLKVFIDGGDTPQTVYSNPDIVFEPNDEIFVVFSNRDSQSKYALSKRAIEYDYPENKIAPHHIVLSNENQSILTDSNGSTKSKITITSLVDTFKGSKRVDGVIGTLLLKDSNGAAITGATLSSVNPTTAASGNVTMTINSGVNLSADVGFLEIPITIEGNSYIKKLNWNKAKDGVNGEGAKYVIVTGQQVFKYATGVTVPTNTSITLSAIVYNITSPTYQWQHWNGSTWTNLSKTGHNTSTYTVAYNDAEWGTNSNKRYRCLVSSTYSDELTISHLYDGDKGEDGSNGDYVDYRFKRSATTPTAPTVASPSDWFDAPPSGTDKLWMIKATKSGLDHTLIGNWSSPIQINGDNGTNGTDGNSVFVQYSIDGSTSWHDIFATGDKYMRTKVGINGTWSDSIKIVGENGSSAKLLYLSTTSEIMTFTSAGVADPASQTITLTANLQNLTGTATFTATPYDSAGNALTVITLGGTGNSRTLTQAQWTSNAVRIAVEATLDGLKDTVSIYQLKAGADGKSSIVGFLTNESITLPANSAGTVSDFSTATGTFEVYEGITKKTGTSVTYAKTAQTGCTASITTAGVYSVTAMTADSATATFTATYGGVTITKVLSLAKSRAGVNGENGISALTAVLSNEAHTISTDSSGNNGVYTNSGTTISLYEGSNELTYDGVGTTNGTWKVTASGSGITASTTITDSGAYVTIGNHSAMTADAATVTYTITGKRTDGSAISLSKTQTLSKSKAGVNAKVASITASSQIFKSTDGGLTFSPNTITLTPQLQNVAFSKWQYSTDGGSTFVDASGANGVTIASNVLTLAKGSTLYTDTITAIVFKLVTNDVAISDVLTIVKLYDVTKVKVGGRNLNVDSRLRRVASYGAGILETTQNQPSNRVKVSWNTQSGLTNMGLVPHTDDRKASYMTGEPYTLSFKARGNVTYFDYCYLMREDGSNSNFSTVNVSLSETEFTKVVMTLPSISWSTKQGYFLIGTRDIGTGKWFEVEEVQVENGNTDLNWRLSDEDLDNQFSDNDPSILNKNPNFHRWGSGFNIPDDYYLTGTGVSKVNSTNKQGNAVRFDVTAGSNLYIGQLLSGKPFFQYMYVEATFMLESGTIDGAGMYVGYEGVSGDTAYIPIKDIIPNPEIGKWYTVSKITKVSWSTVPTGFTGYRVYAMGGWTTFGTIATKVIQFDSLKVRPATESEVYGYETGTVVDGWKSDAIENGKVLINGGLLEAHTVLVKHLAIGDFANLATSSEITGETSNSSSSGLNKIENGYIVKTDILNPNLMVCDFTVNNLRTNDELYYEFEGYTPTATKNITFAVWCYDASKAYIGGSVSSTITLTNINAKYTGSVKLTHAQFDNAAYFLVGFTCDDIDLRVKKVIVRKKYAGELLVDGSIKAKHVTAEGLSFNVLKGDTMTLGGANNTNGKMTVLDANGDVIADLDAEKGGFSDLYIAKLESPTVVSYAENFNVTYYVSTVAVDGYGVTPSDDNTGLGWNSPLATIEGALKKIPIHFNGTVTIRLAGGLRYYTNINIQGYTGGGEIIIDGVDKTNTVLVGAITVTRNTVNVKFSNLTIQTTKSNVAISYTSSNGSIVNCIVYGLSSGTTLGIAAYQGSAVEVFTTEIYDVAICISSRNNCSIFIDTCKGYGTTCGIHAYGGYITGRISSPTGVTPQILEAGGQIFVSFTPNSGTYVLPTPAETTKLISTTSGSNYSTQGFWDSGVKQGNYGYGRRTGTWYFGANILNTIGTGKTIKAVRVYISRTNSGGTSGGVRHSLRAHSYQSQPAGAPTVSAEIGYATLKWGQGAWVTVNPSFYASIANGTYRGFAIYVDSDSNSLYSICSTSCTVEITYQ